MTLPPESTVRLLIVGGFLGAGKTTSLLTLARLYHDEGKRAALVTNDQAENLVDTGMVRVRGFRVEEVAGACFCCKFGELAEAADRIRTEEKPDVLLAEPVGSCTDLAATVVAPLRRLYGDRYSIAPYSVLVDPTRAREIILGNGLGGFSAKVAYIFRKQLEEAEVICLNKVDLLRGTEEKEIIGALSSEFRKARVIGISARTGQGFAAWRGVLEGSEAIPNIAEIDYDIYAEGEAELGWLNLALSLEGERSFEPHLVVLELLDRMREALAARGAEVAHLKAMLRTPTGSAVANCVTSRAPVRISEHAGPAATEGRIVLNARVHMDPEELRIIAGNAIAGMLAGQGLSGRIEGSTHFRPGRPVPTYRFSAS